MDSGEHCYISVARTGLLIKESRMGIFGRTVFRVDDINECAYLAQSLSDCLWEDLTPPTMVHPVLKMVTNEVLHFEALSDIPVIFGAWIDHYRSGIAGV